MFHGLCEAGDRISGLDNFSPCFRFASADCRSRGIRIDPGKTLFARLVNGIGRVSAPDDGRKGGQSPCS